ncbi:transposase zinc-binding domain-containing protein [Stigmatella sp. ncwal1]|uniref:Transposase zinc-binding domain-containing protein n=1 Tax=Stigmatella ashevillensis TaxID=2995309 RepID=A0ABT5DD83_9BACT|nr:transposase zinc-binding domain-containing protein [Stigmatella ashevillena]MDC0711622.1 transposase zinc-binding domain-containing protein [Stigmatella ashevillena]
MECGVLAHGFARVRCESGKDEFLVAFSCKSRGVCPSCNAKRAHVTAVQWVERVLPDVPYQQWTLSFPHRVRWVLLKDVGLLSDVLTLFLRGVFALQRRRARRQSLRGGPVGAVSFIPFFGSALQVTPHFHSLVPDGVFVPWEGGVRFEPLPPPTQAEVERLLRGGRHRVLLQTYSAHSLQQRLRWTEVDVRLPPRKQPRCAFLEGFSLHAHTHLHANDRQGLERRCRYGARGALALERYGVFAPGAKVRPFLLLQAGAEPGLTEESPAFAATVEEPSKERTRRLDWAGLLKRTFALEVFAWLEVVRVMVEHLGLPPASEHLAPARAPPQSAGC